MVNHIGVSTQDPLSANDFRDVSRVTLLLRIGPVVGNGRVSSTTRAVTIMAKRAAAHIRHARFDGYFLP